MWYLCRESSPTIGVRAVVLRPLLIAREKIKQVSLELLCTSVGYKLIGYWSDRWFLLQILASQLSLAALYRQWRYPVIKNGESRRQKSREKNSSSRTSILQKMPEFSSQWKDKMIVVRERREVPTSLMTSQTDLVTNYRRQCPHDIR